MKETICRAIVSRFDLRGNVDSTFNRGMGVTLGTGLGQTLGLQLGLSSEHICVSGMQIGGPLAWPDKNNLFALKLNQWDGSFYTPFGGNGLCVRPLPDESKGMLESVGMLTSNNGAVTLSGRLRLKDNSKRMAVFIRLTDRGAFDHTFGDNGIIMTNKDDMIYGFVNKSNDEIFVGVKQDPPSSKLQFVNFNPSEDSVNYTEIDLNSKLQFIAKHISHLGNRIYIAGHTRKDDAVGYFIAGLTTAGQLDRTFGTDGLVVSQFNTSINTQALHVTNDFIYLVGDSPSTRNTLGLARHKLSGEPDGTFSGNGKLVVSYKYIGSLSISGLAVSANGTIYLVGSGNQKLFLCAFNENGDRLGIFGENSLQVEPGTLLFDRFEKTDNANPHQFQGSAIELSPDGTHLVVCGTSIE